ncbi:MAG: LysR substrate-binding domain-containing protein [Francisellaceae bacterium]
MNFRDLEYIIAVSEERNFNRAAQKCYVSQPALSMQIKKVEEELGVDIFERFQKTVLITKAGAIIIEKAKEALKVRHDIEQIAQNFVQDRVKQIKVGLFPTLAQYLLPGIIRNASEAAADLSIYPIEEKTSVLVDMLRTGRIDVALLAGLNEEDQGGLIFEPLFTDEFKLAVFDDHPIARLKKVDIKALRDESMLILEQGHCLRDQILSLNIEGAKPIQCNATSLETLRQMVIAKLGITIMPEISTKNTDFKGIKYLDFKAPAPSRTIGLVYRKSTPIEHLIEEFKDIVGKSLTELYK